MVQPHYWILLNSGMKRNNDTCNNVDRTQENYAEWKKKTNLKVYILYNSTYLTFLKQQNYRDEEQISGSQKLEMGGGVVMAIKRSRRDPCGDETVLYLDCSGGYTNSHMS